MDVKRPEFTIKVDWITSTLRPVLTATYEQGRSDQRIEIVNDLLSEFNEKLLTIPSGRKRRPYIGHHELEKKGGGLFVNPKLNYCSVEFSGVGCTRLEKSRQIAGVIYMLMDNMTRFDLAIDIKTKMRPIEFLADGYSKRIKTIRTVNSPTGETIYLGSALSDTYCRVYRYHEPHPRHEWLRIELVARADMAKIYAKIWGTSGSKLCAWTMAEKYKFQSPLWAQIQDGEPVEFRIEGEERTDAKTVHWLMKQVKPALERLQASGSLPPVFWFMFLENVPNIAVYIDDKIISEGDKKGDWEQLTFL